MTLSPESLHPLVATPVEFSYTRKRLLKCIATRYTQGSSDKHDTYGPDAYTLLFCNGISLNQETSIPVFKDLFRLTSSARVRIRSVWAVERPNHGDAGVLNEKELKEHFSTSFSSLEYGAAIRAFLAADILSSAERASLVAVGHSGGTGSLIEAIGPLTSNFPVKSLILVELPYIGMEGWPHLLEPLHKAVRISNARRISTWPSVQSAMAWYRSHLPWKAFHEDVLGIIEETYFRTDPNAPRSVVPKTTVQQETATFCESDGAPFRAKATLDVLLNGLPVYLVLGSKNDLWPSALYEQHKINLEKDEAKFASVMTVQGGGHYLPQQMPYAFASAIVRILGKLSGHADTANSRL